MPRLVLLSLVLLAACRADAPAQPTRTSFCSDRMFDGSRFTVCSARGGAIEVRTGKVPYRSFSKLEAALGKQAGNVAFAMNAGMFDEGGRAIGLLIEDAKELHAINRNKGGGNFHLMPNGVLLVRKSGKAEVVPSERFRPARDIAFATQSGPMLVIDGNLHPAFDQDGTSLHIRNGVGIGTDGKARFVISQDGVSFGKLARFFRDRLKCDDALFFDGAVSALWDPPNRRDVTVPLGPIVVVLKPGA